MEEKKKQLKILIDLTEHSDEYHALKELAKREDRPLGQYARRFLINALKEYLKQLRASHGNN